MGDGGAEGSSAIGDRGQAAVSLMPATDGMNVRIFESSQLDVSCVGDFSSVQSSCSVVSDSLRPHESQHARPACPSPTPGVHSDSRPSSQ